MVNGVARRDPRDLQLKRTEKTGDEKKEELIILFVPKRNFPWSCLNRIRSQKSKNEFLV